MIWFYDQRPSTAPSTAHKHLPRWRLDPARQTTNEANPGWQFRLAFADAS
jgi:hypothetical protein